MSALTPLDAAGLSRLHRHAVEEQAQIMQLLEEARLSGAALHNGVDRKNAPRVARVVAVRVNSVVLSTENIPFDRTRQIFFNFSLDDRKYFFAATPALQLSGSRLAIAFPSAIYEAERRDTGRLPAGSNPSIPTRIEISAHGGHSLEARVLDCSYDGLAVAVPNPMGLDLPVRFPVRFLDGDRAGQTAYAQIRHTAEPTGSGWRKIGLAVSGVEVDSLIPIERRENILGQESLRGRIRRNAAEVRALLGNLPPRPAKARRGGHLIEEVHTVEYQNEYGERIAGIVDCVGNPLGAPAIVIPPAWGRTKETLLPLAETLLASFERSGESLTVLRFDGTNRRGESHIDPSCRTPGNEYLRFRFSRAVADIEATIRFVSTDARFRAPAVVLVTFSLAAVAGRRAVANNRDGGIAGWIAVVGMVDLQSGLRTVSGGVDYAFGLRHGVRFGIHELVGVRANMDHTGLDALESNLVFLEDARRDMAKIRVPVTWLHGRHDAWMDINRVRDVMSAGPQAKRRLIEVPTGHQLRTSREALQTFQVVSQEAGKMLTPSGVAPAVPNPAKISRRSRAERGRLSQIPVDVRAFWSDYLLGRNRKVGIDLMAATSAYGELMARQIDLLQIRNNATIVDLGSGTGGFRAALRQRLPDCDVNTIEIDFVPEALMRSRLRWKGLRSARSGAVHVTADLDVAGRKFIPLGDGIADAVLASLFVSYVKNPLALLREVARILRRGGRLVMSSLRRDADISRIYVHGVREVFASDLERRLGIRREAFGDLQRQFLNDAGKILEMEERGVFHFRDEAELLAIVRDAGFTGVHVERSFGEPPQAVVIAASRR